MSSSSSSTTTPATTTTTTSRITTTSTTQPPTSTSTSGTTTQATTTSSAFTTTASTFTTSSWSLSTSGTVTFSHLVPSVGTVTNSPGANTSDGGSSVFTPVFWGVTGAILGAIALLAGAICFIRGRVRNKRNDRVYRPGGFGGTVGGGAAAGGAAGAGGRAFQPGLGSAQRPSFTGAAGKGNASAGYAGGVVTLVELSDANPQPPQSPPLHPYGPTPPPTTQPQYGVPVSMPMQGYPSMPPAGGAPEYGAYAYGDPNMSTGMPPKQSGGYDMQPSGGTYDPQAYPMMSSASPVAPAIGGGQDDGVITFAPTMQRDDEYMQQAPPGMEYRMNEHTGQQELHYVDQHHSGGGGAYQQQQQYGAEMNRTGSPLNGNAPGVTRQLRLPGQH